MQWCFSHGGNLQADIHSPGKGKHTKQRKSLRNLPGLQVFHHLIVEQDEQVFLSSHPTDQHVFQNYWKQNSAGLNSHYLS